MTHSLTNIDPDRRRADCAECGPNSPIRRRFVSDERPGWRCRPASEGGAYGRASVEGRARRKRRERAKRYGLTVEELDAMIERQGDCCAICRRPAARGRRLAIDHCHTSGKVRSLLCTNCNTALGLFQDDPEIMRRAIAYLAEHAP